MIVLGSFDASCVEVAVGVAFFLLLLFIVSGSSNRYFLASLIDGPFLSLWDTRHGYFCGIRVSFPAQDMGKLAAASLRARALFTELRAFVDVPICTLGGAGIAPAEHSKVTTNASAWSGVNMREHASVTESAVGKMRAMGHSVLVRRVRQSTGGFGVLAGISEEARTDGDLGRIMHIAARPCVPAFTCKDREFSLLRGCKRRDPTQARLGHVHAAGPPGGPNSTERTKRTSLLEITTQRIFLSISEDRGQPFHCLQPHGPYLEGVPESSLFDVLCLSLEVEGTGRMMDLAIRLPDLVRRYS